MSLSINSYGPLYIYENAFDTFEENGIIYYNSNEDNWIDNRDESYPFQQILNRGKEEGFPLPKHNAVTHEGLYLTLFEYEEEEEIKVGWAISGVFSLKNPILIIPETYQVSDIVSIGEVAFKNNSYWEEVILSQKL